MNNILEKISLKLGLTKTEVKTILFVIVTFILGLGLNIAKIDFSVNPIKKFNYNFQDSLFDALNSRQPESTDTLKIIEKMVDSEQELLDFSKHKKESKKNKSLTLKLSSININNADVGTLTKLPGIGVKTAEKIIKLREKKSRISSIEELTEVKGIGKKKLSKIKKYIYVDKKILQPPEEK